MPSPYHRVLIDNEAALQSEESFDGDPQSHHVVTTRGWLLDLLARSGWAHWLAHLTTAGFIISLLGNKLNHGCTPATRSDLVRPSEAFWQEIDHLAQTSPFFYSRRPHLDPQQEKWAGFPNLENTALWSDLVSVGMANVTATESSQIHPEPAHRIEDEGRFVVNLQVYHDLHCLNMMREAFWEVAEVGVPVQQQSKNTIRHIDHCIQILRQGLMCQADLSPISSFWDPERGRYWVEWDVARQCRNWNNVHEWARERQMSIVVS